MFLKKWYTVEGRSTFIIHPIGQKSYVDFQESCSNLQTKACSKTHSDKVPRKADDMLAKNKVSEVRLPPLRPRMFHS